MYREKVPYVSPEVVEGLSFIHSPAFMIQQAAHLKVTPEEFSGYVKGVASIIEILESWSLPQNDTGDLLQREVLRNG